MTSNSENMTLEEKIVQHLKSDTLGKLVDEDALAKLVSRAIEESMFKERRVPGENTWSSPRVFSSPVVEAAQEVGRTAAKKLIDDIAGKMLENQEFRDAICKRFATEIAVAMSEIARNTVATSIRSVTGDQGYIEALYNQLKIVGERDR